MSIPQPKPIQVDPKLDPRLCTLVGRTDRFVAIRLRALARDDSLTQSRQTGATNPDLHDCRVYISNR